MATYTDNYQLTKPTYAEQADIGVINSNMNIIDDIMHSSQASLAPAYDQSQTYAEGDVVMYELLMYKCISPTTGVWDGSKWERTTASESGGGGSAELDILGEGSGAVVSFADGASAELAKCIAEIVPKQAGSGTPSPSNVRAISGYTAVKVNVTNKNHLRMTLNGLKNRNTGGTWNGNVYTLNNLTFTVNADTNGVVNSITVNGTNANTYTRFTLDLPILISGQTYTLSGAPSGYSGTNATIYLGNSPATIGIQNPAISGGVPVTFTPTQTGEPTANINVNAGVTVNNAVFYPQIELGSEATTYEAYAGSTTTTPLGQTVYGGRLNVLTGELVIDKIFVEMDDVTWTVLDSSGNKYRYYTDIVGMKKMAVRSMDILCSCYETNMGGGAWVDNTIWNSTNLNRVVVVTSQYQTANAFMASLTDQTMLVDMETPLVIQIPPTTINSLLGQNNISADTGDIDIVYVKASAPIQPNPTGTPTATLKKLGIEGTVFEVEGGGGGSSSGINYSTTEQVIGTWIDGKPLYQKTFDLTAVQLTDNTWNANILGTIGIRIKHFEGLFSIGQTEPSIRYDYYRSSSEYFTAMLVNDSSDINVRPNINAGTLYAGIVTIQYTKITD